jgi:GNAT superfamily N-acetyltransferase
MTDAARDTVTVRTLGPGDMGLLLHRYALATKAEFGWNDRHEADLTAIAADFLQKHDPTRERFWVAVRGGAVVGSVALVDAGAGRAKLRMLFVDPAARGLGLGTTLVATCLTFAREAGYREVVLWTMDVMAGARRLYERAGFGRVASEPFTDYGVPLNSETWRLTL